MSSQEESADAIEIEPVTLEVIWSRLRGIAEEMGTHFKRTAFSEIVKLADDLSTGLFTADGRLISQGVYTPGMLGPMPYAMRNILEDHFPRETWNPGDIVITNDPFIGSGHLPDLFTFQPVFIDGDLEGFSVTVGHKIDIGGSAPGSFVMHGDDLYEEGLQVPPVKLYEAGTRNDELFETIVANSRMSDKNRGDILAQAGASRVGVDLYTEVLNEYGPTTANAYIEEIFDRSETGLRSALEKVPDGTYTASDYIDGFDDPIPLQVQVSIDGDDITVDFDGTAEQQFGASINSPLNYTASYVIMAIKSVVDPDTPQTHGSLRPTTIDAPANSIVNPSRPAPVGSRHILADRIVNVINAAFHEAVPGEIPANGGQNCSIVMKSLDDESMEQNVTFDMSYGGSGARAQRDGFPALAGSVNIKNLPVEVLEAETSIRIHRYELLADSAGAGQYRGGSSTIKEYEFGQRTELQLMCDRFDTGPYGLEGGQAGRPGEAVLNPGTDGERQVGSKELLSVADGDVLRLITPGGGGYGAPSERDQKSVARDVANGVVSEEAALDTYDVPTDALD